MPVLIDAPVQLKKLRRGTPLSYNSKLVHPGDVKVLHFNGTEIKVQYGADGFWRDDSGCIFGFVDTEGTKDKVVRCGVSVFSLPESHPLTDACAKHDYAYTCPSVQASYTREEIDEILKRDIKRSGYGILAYPFYFLTRLFGRFFWENDKTNR